MEIQLARGDEQLGVFDLYEVRWKLSAGELLPTDLARVEGQTRWQPLGSLPEVTAPTASPVSPAAEPPGLPLIHKRAGVAPIAISRRPSPPVAPVETSSVAVASLVCGILSFVIPFLPAIPGVICGHVARSQIGESGGRVGGARMALWGLVLSYLNLALIPVISIGAAMVIPVLQQRGNFAKEIAASGNAMVLVMSCRMYALSHHGEFPRTLDDLYPEYVQDRSSFQSHLGPRPEPVGFVYFGGNKRDPGRKILLQSKVPVRPGQYIVGHVDGTVGTEAAPAPVTPER